MNKRQIAVACLAFGILAPQQAHADPTVAELAARLNAIEKENATLRARIGRLESGRPEVTRVTPDRGAARAQAAALRPSATGLESYNAYKAPPIVSPPSNWTGAYVGASFGWGSQSSKQPTALSASGFGTGIPVGPLLTANVTSAVALASVPASVTTDPNGFIGGGQAGYNYQIDRFVIGAEADLSAIGIAGRASPTGAFAASPPPTTFVSATTSVNSEQHLDWLGTVRARVGYVPTSNLLLYATGGLAYGRITSSTSISQGVCTFTGAGGFCNTVTGAGSASATQAGWALGGGFEYALAEHWSVKAEYLHYDLGSLSYGVSALSTPVLPSFTNPGTTITTNVGATARFNGDIGRVGLNYKFQ